MDSQRTAEGSSARRLRFYNLTQILNLGTWIWLFKFNRRIKSSICTWGWTPTPGATTSGSFSASRIKTLWAKSSSTLWILPKNPHSSRKAKKSMWNRKSIFKSTQIILKRWLVEIWWQHNLRVLQNLQVTRGIMVWERYGQKKEAKEVLPDVIWVHFHFCPRRSLLCLLCALHVFQMFLADQECLWVAIGCSAIWKVHQGRGALQHPEWARASDAHSYIKGSAFDVRCHPRIGVW